MTQNNKCFFFFFFSLALYVHHCSAVVLQLYIFILHLHGVGLIEQCRLGSLQLSGLGWGGRNVVNSHQASDGSHCGLIFPCPRVSHLRESGVNEVGKRNPHSGGDIAVTRTCCASIIHLNTPCYSKETLQTSYFQSENASP